MEASAPNSANDMWRESSRVAPPRFSVLCDPRPACGGAEGGVRGGLNIGISDHDEGWRVVGSNVRRPPALERQGKAFLLLLRWLVGKDHDARTGRLGTYKFQSL